MHYAEASYPTGLLIPEPYNKIPQSIFLPCGISCLFKNYFTFTFMVTVLVLPFNKVTFAFTVAVPAFFAVTLPLFETVATDFFEVV
jgi:hypothetical protein